MHIISLISEHIRKGGLFKPSFRVFTVLLACLVLCAPLRAEASVTVGGKTVEELFSDPGDDVFAPATDIVESFGASIYKVSKSVAVIVILISIAGAGYGIMSGNARRREEGKAKLVLIIISLIFIFGNVAFLGIAENFSKCTAERILSDTNSAYTADIVNRHFENSHEKFEYVVRNNSGSYRYGDMMSYLGRYNLGSYINEWISLLGSRYEGY